MFSDLIGLRLEVWNRLFSNRLFSRNKKYDETTKIWLLLILHKIHVDIQITSLEHPRLLSILLDGYRRLLRFVACCGCGGINPYTLMAKLGPARIGGFGPPKDDVRPG